MSGIHHTFNALLPGYESLEITMDVQTRQSQLNIMARAGRPATAIVDFPNWEIAAPVCRLFTLDPATGELTDEPICKPEMPLTNAAMRDWPSILVYYLTGNQCLRDGLDDYLQHAHPNLKAG